MSFTAAIIIDGVCKIFSQLAKHQSDHTGRIKKSLELLNRAIGLSRPYSIMASRTSTSARDVNGGAEDVKFGYFPSRRSVVHSTNGIVSCTQPLAAEAGVRILKQGGNAAVRSLHIVLRVY
jgi:hypothetical protein